MAPLTVAMESYPHTAALLDGSIEPEGLRLQRTSGPAFREMVRSLAFDVAELAIVTYLAALDHGVPIVALPVFVTRSFDHAVPFVNAAAGIDTPKQLEGRRIGTRYFGFTDSMWARGMLAESHDVDLDSITWVLSDDEHVEETVLPGNVDMEPGADLVQMVESGDLDAYFGPYRGTAPSVRQLFPDPDAAARSWFDSTRVFPIHHLIAIRADLLDVEPGLAGSLYRAFVAAKEPVIERLNAGTPLDAAEQRLAAQRVVVGDPLPYGIEANRLPLETIVRYAHDQHLLSRCFAPEELFVAHVED